MLRFGFHLRSGQESWFQFTDSRSMRLEKRTALADHLSAELLTAYRRRRLQPAELLALSDHVVACSACRRMLRAALPARDALISLHTSLQIRPSDGDHLSPQQLRDWVEGRLQAADRELAETHLGVCSGCCLEAEEYLLAWIRRTG